MTLKRGRFRVSDRLAVPEKPFGLTLPALPQLLFAGRLYDLPANSAAAEIAASLLLPLAARGRNSSGFSTAAEKAPALYPPQAAGRRFSPLKNDPILKRPRGACGPPVGFPEGLRGTDEGTTPPASLRSATSPCTGEAFAGGEILRRCAPQDDSGGRERTDCHASVRIGSQ